MSNLRGSLQTLKEEVEDTQTINRIYNLLAPREFTKLDEIVEIVFFTAEEVKYNEPEALPDNEISLSTAYASFTDACIVRIEKHMNISLIKRSRVSYSDPDNHFQLVCLVSKLHLRTTQNGSWFAFRPPQKEFLEQSSNSYIALGCGSEENVLLIPYVEFAQWITDMNITEQGDRFYWHIEIYISDGNYVLHRKRGSKTIRLSSFLL